MLCTYEAVSRNLDYKYEKLQTLVANFKLVKVSLRCACNGLIITNISVFELPPSEYCRRYVSCPEKSAQMFLSTRLDDSSINCIWQLYTKPQYEYGESSWNWG